MDAERFDQLSRQVSRRGIGVLLGAGILTAHVPDISAKVGPCGGRPNLFTKHCNGKGSCDVAADCAAGCACVELRQGCCFRVKKKKGKGGAKRKCVDGAPNLYCAPVAAP